MKLINIPYKRLSPFNNVYSDESGRQYLSEGRTSIDFVDASIVQKIILVVISISKKILMSFGGLFT